LQGTGGQFSLSEAAGQLQGDEGRHQNELEDIFGSVDFVSEIGTRRRKPGFRDSEEVDADPPEVHHGVRHQHALDIKVGFIAWTMIDTNMRYF
jgi:hypothetical protein